MSDRAKWLIDLDAAAPDQAVDGLVPVTGYDRAGRPPEEVAVMEKAKAYGRTQFSSKPAAMIDHP